MRSLTVLAALLVAGCATFGWTGSESLSTMVGVAPDTALRIASTQLQHHGYDVATSGGTTIVTLPRLVPQYLLPLSTDAAAREAMAKRQILLQVTVNPAPYSAGTRIDVAGFLVPTDDPPSGANALTRSAIRITEDEYPELFREVRAAAGWITDALTSRVR